MFPAQAPVYAQALLEEGRYITPEEGRASGVAKQSLILIRRTMGRPQEVLYHVTDQPPPPKDSAWYRVAAIFVTGASWQFKDYPLDVRMCADCLHVAL